MHNTKHVSTKNYNENENMNIDDEIDEFSTSNNITISATSKVVILKVCIAKYAVSYKINTQYIFFFQSYQDF